MEQDNIVFLQSFKWSKKCSKCGEQIEEGSQGFWDKNAKPYLYYHTSCYHKDKTTKASAASLDSRVATPAAGANLSSKESKQQHNKQQPAASPELHIDIQG